MKNLLYSLLAVLALVSCSKEEEVVTPPAPNKYTLTITAETGGTVSTEGGLYNEGSKITVTATPDGMYLFKEWSDGSTQNPREITVTSNLTLKASFIKKTYPLAVTVEGEGTVTEEVIIQGSTTETEYNAGTTVRLTATPNEGWVFAGWSGDVESEELVIEVPIEKGTSVSALFKRDSFELNITIEGEGTVKEEVIVQPGQYDYETVVRLTAIPADGWKFASWSGDVESQEMIVEVELKSEINLTVNFEYALFVSKAENFSPINQTTGFYSKIATFQNYLSLEEGRYFFNYFNNEYMPDNRDLITYDFDEDGKLDLFMFGMASDIYDAINPTHKNGRYFFISDYLNQSPPYNIIQHNSIVEFAAGGINMQDLNGDGRKEIIIFTTNNHQKYSRFFIGKPNYLVNPPELLGVVVLEVDDEFQILSERTLGTPKAIHGSSTGDVDNDGDIDILSFPLGNRDHQDGIQMRRFPTILYNSGNGDFVEDFIFKNKLLEETYWDLSSTSSHFFDVDGDGYLDLIFGQWMGYTNLFTPPNDLIKFLELLDAYILWGDGSGKFSFEDRTALELINENGYNLSLLGQSFTDFDRDGDIDILLVSTRVEPDRGDQKGSYYDTYLINLLENKGNRVFIDVTTSKIDGYYDNTSYIDVIYDIAPIDKNEDGWIDLVPKEVTIFCCYGSNKEFVSNLWWENVGGSFVRRIED